MTEKAAGSGPIRTALAQSLGELSVRGAAEGLMRVDRRMALRPPNATHQQGVQLFPRGDSAIRARVVPTNDILAVARHTVAPRQRPAQAPEDILG